VSPQNALLAAFLLPLAGALLVAITGRWPNLRETVSLTVAALTFWVVTTLVPGVMAGERPVLEMVEVFPGLALSFELEPLGMLFAGPRGLRLHQRFLQPDPRHRGDDRRPPAAAHQNPRRRDP
jgi:hypothetical protein